jgi:hypothetical protein
VGILEDQRLTRPQGLAVDLEDPVTLVVLDPVVIADRYQLLPHPEVRPAIAAASLLAPLSAPVS